MSTVLTNKICLNQVFMFLFFFSRMNTREITDRKGRHFLWSEFDGLGYFSGFVKRFAPQGLDAKYAEVRNLEMRDDDLMICTYPKTGRGPKVVKLFFMLNSAEHEIYPAHKCENANNCWHFNIY